MICGMFDSHAHYYDRKFDDVGGAEKLLRSGEFCERICGVVNISSNPENANIVIEQAKKYPFMYCAVGIHPTDAQVPEGSIEDNIGKIEGFLRDGGTVVNKIVAIGEIGYDYYWEPVDRKLQRAYFDAQMRLAQKYSLPVIIHDRDAHGDVFDMICAYPDVVGVIHSCSMSAEMVSQICRRGWYISFSGTLTFKNASNVRAACASVPRDRLLCETDAPYLAPVPYRGQVNNSLLMEMTMRKMAEIHGVSFEDMCEITHKNAKKFFGLSNRGDHEKQQQDR